MTFSSLGLSPPLVAALQAGGISTPTSIQNQAIPGIIAGRDMLAAAQTGTGKTVAFGCSMLQRLQGHPAASSNCCRALVLVPSRELAVQVADALTQFAANTSQRVLAVYGGVKINPQMRALLGGVEVLVATPGRLLDLHRSHAIGFAELRLLVLDEADKMLDLGFSQELDALLAVLPLKRQTLLFSATLSQSVRRLAAKLVKQPVEIAVTPKVVTAAPISHWLYGVDKRRKQALLLHLIEQNHWHQLLIFTNTRKGANQLVRQLEGEGWRVAGIHGDRSQAQRMQALAEFKSGLCPILVATDVAARGLDIPLLPRVINLDLPTVAENYVHRVGRTGRAGAAGEAISLVSADEIDALKAIERQIQQVVPRHEVEGFEPDHQLPLSPSVPGQLRPRKPKKPKKNRVASAASPSSPGDRASKGRIPGGRGGASHTPFAKASTKTTSKANAKPSPRPNRNPAAGGNKPAGRDPSR